MKMLPYNVPRDVSPAVGRKPAHFVIVIVIVNRLVDHDHEQDHDYEKKARHKYTNSIAAIPAAKHGALADCGRDACGTLNGGDCVIRSVCA